MGAGLFPSGFWRDNGGVPPQRKSNSLKATAHRAETSSATLRANVGTVRLRALAQYGTSPRGIHTSSSTSFARRYRKGVEGQQPCNRCPPLPCTSFPQLATNLQPSVVLSPGQLAREVAGDGQIYERIGGSGGGRTSQIFHKIFPAATLFGGSERSFGSNGSSYIRVL